MGVFIGLDVSLAKTAVCVVDRDGAVLWQGKVASEPGPLIKRLAEWPDSIEIVGIEAVSVHSRGGVSASICSAGCSVVGVAIGPIG
jgi:hypothetical protein